MLTFIESGLSTTVQDLGRSGHYNVGIPPSGAMDRFAHSVANALVGNPVGAATLEVTLLGPKIRFESATVFAVTGADMGSALNDAPIPLWESIAAKPGDVLSLTYAGGTGCRAYVAVSGGIDVPLVLGSRSTYSAGYLGGYRGRKILAGVKLASGTPHAVARPGVKLGKDKRPLYRIENEIAVMLGPQDHLFTKAGVSTFLNSEYVVTAATSRTASRLSGPTPEALDRVHSPDEGDGPTDIIEDGNAVGTIQIAGGAEPIVMLRDAPSTGGYAKIATVISVDLEALGQVKPSDKISFTSVSFDEARKRFATWQKALFEALDCLK